MSKRISRMMAWLLTLALALSVAPCALAETVDKKETVYVLADATGAAQRIIVSEKLTNKNAEAELRDESRLKDIENVSGEETYTEDNGVLVWKADGASITYQGTSEEELPVGMTVKYTLDGQVVTPEELAGKSGHLVMDVEYASNLTGRATVNGEELELPVPFLMATVMLIDGDVFQNVEVTHGRLLEVGDRKLIVTWGLPGLHDALDLSNDEIEEKIDMEIPTGAQITADVTNFTLSGSYTAATNALFQTLDEAELDKELDVDDMTGELSDAMSQLLDGAQQLRDGNRELADGLLELDGNSDTLADAAKQVLDTVLATANQTLEGKRDTFEQYNIALNELTLDNYADEIARIQEELLKTAEAEVERQAGEQLTEKVTEAVREEVAKKVDEAVRAEVVKQVEEAARQQVTAAVEEAVGKEVRSKVNAAVRAQVESKVTEAVRAQVSAQVDAVLNDQIHQKVIETVKAAVTSQVNAQKDAVTSQVTESYRTAIKAQVEASLTDDQKKSMTAEQLAAYVEQATAQLLSGKQDEISAKVDETIQGLIDQNMASDAVQQQIAAAEQEQLKNRDALLASAVNSQMATDTVKATISKNVEDQMASNTIKKTIEQNYNAQMASDTVKKTIDQNVTEQMNSDNIKKTIDKNVTEQMASDKVKGLIETNLAEQMKGKEAQEAIEKNVAEQRETDTFKETVEKAKAENGVQSESYQSLTTLKETLDSMKSFYEGVLAYTGAVGDAAEGAQKLADGSSELYDGLQRFNDEAVSKILSLINDDLEQLIDRAKAVCSLMEDYQSYAGKSAEMTGSVQFLIRTPEI